MSVSRVSAFALSKQTHLSQLITGLLSCHEVGECMPQAHGLTFRCQPRDCSPSVSKCCWHRRHWGGVGEQCAKLGLKGSHDHLGGRQERDVVEDMTDLLRLILVDRSKQMSQRAMSS